MFVHYASKKSVEKIVYEECTKVSFLQKFNAFCAKNETNGKYTTFMKPIIKLPAINYT